MTHYAPGAFMRFLDRIFDGIFDRPRRAEPKEVVHLLTDRLSYRKLYLMTCGLDEIGQPDWFRRHTTFPDLVTCPDCKQTAEYRERAAAFSEPETP